MFWFVLVHHIDLTFVTDPNQKCIVEEWDCSLPDAVPPSLNTQPAGEFDCLSV